MPRNPSKAALRSTAEKCLRSFQLMADATAAIVRAEAAATAGRIAEAREAALRAIILGAEGAEIEGQVVHETIAAGANRTRIRRARDYHFATMLDMASITRRAARILHREAAGATARPLALAA